MHYLIGYGSCLRMAGAASCANHLGIWLFCMSIHYSIWDGFVLKNTGGVGRGRSLPSSDIYEPLSNVVLWYLMMRANHSVIGAHVEKAGKAQPPPPPFANH